MTLRIDVDVQTRRILRFLGVLVMDRDLDRSPATSEQEAIESARSFLRQLPEFDAARFLFDDNDSATRVYAPWGEDGVLTPVWRIALEKNTSIYPGAAPELLLVGPSGEVMPAGVLLNGTQEHDTQSQARANPRAG